MSDASTLMRLMAKAKVDADKLTEASARLEIAVKALEFYANEKNWQRRLTDSLLGTPMNEFLMRGWAHIVDDSGHLARETLAKIRGMG